MMSNPAEQLFQEMEASGRYLKQALDSFKIKIDELDRESALELINQILEKDRVFHYLEIVGYILRKTANADNDFFAVLKKAIEKTSRDLANPRLLNNLVEVGLQNPELGLEIYKKAKELKDIPLVLACRWIFGGVGAKNFNLIYKTVLDDIKAAQPELRIASISAIRIANAKGLESDWKTQVFSLLDSKQNDPDQGVRRDLLYTYLTFYSYAKESCFSAIMALCKNDNQLNYDALSLLHHSDLSTEHYLQLIDFLSTSEDKSIIEHVLMSFNGWAKKELVETELKIVYNVLKRFSFFGVGSLEEALNEIGKADLETCLKYVYYWLEDRSGKIRFYTPMIAVALAIHDFNKLVDSFNPILYSQKMEYYVFETSRRLLEKIYARSSEGKNPSQSDEKTINNLLEKLKALAKTKGLNSEVIVNREQLSIYKCLILIEVMNSACLNIDFNVIMRNLRLFPNIRDFLGEKWLRKMQREQNKTHPLLVYLTDPLLDPQEIERKITQINTLEGTVRKREEFRVSDSIRNRSLLSHLEKEIGEIKISPSLKNMREALRQEEQFWKVFSEIDVRSRLAQDFCLEIAPPLEIQDGDKTKIKHPDFGMKFEGNEVYIEVISPDMFPPLRYFHNAGIPNRVRNKITDEIKHHFKGMKIPKDVIVIVDLASSELRYESIENYVQGELQFVLRMNKKTHDPEGVFTQRGEPMANIDPQTQIVVGIIGYARVIGTDGKIHLKGRSFLNPHASNKSQVLYKVAEALLG